MASSDLEISWRKREEDDEGRELYEDFSMLGGEILSAGGIDCSRAIWLNEKDEDQAFEFKISLISKGDNITSSSTNKKEEKNELLSIKACYWTMPVNLMQFNMRSQELADLSYTLWASAGRDPDDYDGQEIEFGESEHSDVEISTLVKQASTIRTNDRDHVLYIQKVYSVPSETKAEDAAKFLQLLFSTLPAIVIAHKSDLTSMQIRTKDFKSVGFDSIGEDWFAGPNKNGRK
eukprot:CAMPEP_0178959784 /NCGR_PEP_ID=MMETSP0789-20121207/12521_1 /TAXON_ID=3005 /ORGANISM="Rhizosolenia setigera, Strain CCMP 1694" /LENGTH=232 /DNA_ID=CAMNT_0020642901 /DNA_START=49 /DNA_END=747 /DNA_ORIENTATION=+